jgi:lipopolysaccharide transport system ATP-binding protein
VADGFRSAFTRRREGRAQPGTREFWALRDVSFQIDRGENVGIIGLNGAGKSTLLKTLSRIIEPTEGAARVAGRVGALLEVGTGFHGELTGRENVFLYGAILGMSRGEIARKFDAIVDFSEVEKFIDTPVKRYSSGMYVRLAFAVAAHLEPDILLLDEVLAVGDLPFQSKCMAFARRLQEGNSTILFVSHNMFSIKSMCARVIYLKRGGLAFDGPTEEGLALYEKDCRLSTLNWTERAPEDWPVFIKDVALLGGDLQMKSIFEHGETLRLKLTYETREPVEHPNFIVAFIRSDGVACCNFSTEADGLEVKRIDGIGTIELQTPPLKLVSELYTIHVLVREKGLGRLLCAQIASTFHVRHSTYDIHFGVFHERAEWRWGSVVEVTKP